jgi:predicted phage tail protein
LTRSCVIPTALLYIEFDSSQFNGSIPQISCEPRGRVVRVPDNYNPETREYTGVWTGGFKWAWTDNPAWIYYDIVTADRFGLGNRLSSANISKWTLYQIAQYCDQLVPDGAVVTAWSRAIPVTSTSRNATMLTPCCEILPPFSGA